MRLLQQESILQQQEIRRRNLEAETRQIERENDVLVRSAVDRWVAKEKAESDARNEAWLKKLRESWSTPSQPAEPAPTAPAQDWFTRNAPAETVQVAPPAPPPGLVLDPLDPLDRLIADMPPAQAAGPQKSESPQPGSISRPHAESDSGDPKMTGTWRNGRYWETLSVSEKIAYLVGYGEGFMVAVMVTHEKYETAKRALDILPHQTIGELVEMLDHLYSAPENRRIEIVNAIPLVKGKADGASEAGFNAAVERARRKAAEPTSTMPGKQQ